MTDKIKKPKSNFLLFCDDKRVELKKSHPEMKSTEIIQECSRLWRESSEEEKGVYNKKYQELKLLHPTPQVVKSKTELKPVKEKSKKTVSSYLNFCSKNRESIKSQHTGLNPKDLMKKVAEEWNKLSIEDKSSYKVEVTPESQLEELKPESTETQTTTGKVKSVKVTKRPIKVKNEPELQE